MPTETESLAGRIARVLNENGWLHLSERGRASDMQCVMHLVSAELAEHERKVLLLSNCAHSLCNSLNDHLKADTGAAVGYLVCHDCADIMAQTREALGALK